MHQDVYMNHYIIFQISIIRLEMHKTSTERSRKHQREAGSFDPDKLIEKEHYRIKKHHQRQKMDSKLENEYRLKEILRKRDQRKKTDASNKIKKRNCSIGLKKR